MSLDQWIEIGKIVAPFLALLVAWGMWLDDRRKRYDPCKEEVYSQRIRAYRHLVHAMDGVMKRVSKYSLDMDSAGFFEASLHLNDCFARESVLMHDSVAARIFAFGAIQGEIGDTIGAAPLGSEMLDAYHRRLDVVLNECLAEMRRVLEIEHADIDLAKWRR